MLLFTFCADTTSMMSVLLNGFLLSQAVHTAGKIKIKIFACYFQLLFIGAQTCKICLTGTEIEYNTDNFCGMKH